MNTQISGESIKVCIHDQIDAAGAALGQVSNQYVRYGRTNWIKKLVGNIPKCLHFLYLITLVR
jgi:hypothetical protein